MFRPACFVVFFSLFTFRPSFGQTQLDYRNYQEIFRDDFEYDRLEELIKNWQLLRPGEPDQGWGDEYYSADQVALRSDGRHRRTGVLRLSARRLPTKRSTSRGDKSFVAGHIESIVDMDSSQTCAFDYKGFTYGMAEIRCRLPLGRNGTWPTFWLLSSETEIDVLDNLKPDPAAVIQSGVIDWTRKNRKDSTHLSVEAVLYKTLGAPLSAGFNTYTVVWTPTRVAFFFNGRHLYDVADTAVATHPCSVMLLVNLQMKDYTRQVKNAHFDIDYIRVLKPLANDFTLPYTSETDPAEPELRRTLPQVHPAAGSVVVNPLMVEEVFYRGQDDHLYLARRNRRRLWQTQSLNQLTGAAQDAQLVQGPLRYDIRAGTVFYLGRDGKRQAFVLTDNWQHQDDPAAPGNR